MDLTPTIVPKSDQLNADDLIAGPRTVTIVEVTKGSTEQPVNVVTKEFGSKRPFKPSKSMRRVMVAAWGVDTTTYPGRSMTLFRDPHVKFGGEEVGGIRISHLSHIDKPLTVALTVTRGKRSPFIVQPLGAKTVEEQIGVAVEHFETTFGVTRAELEARLGRKSSEWTGQDVAALRALASALTRGEVSVEDEFPESVRDEGAVADAAAAAFGDTPGGDQ